MNPQLEAERLQLEAQLAQATDWMERRVVQRKLENLAHRLDWSQHLLIRPRP